MRIVQRTPLCDFGASRFETQDDKVTWEYKAIYRQFSMDFRYEELSEQVRRMRNGLDGAQDWAVWSLVVAVCVAMSIETFNPLLAFPTLVMLLVLSVVFFLLTMVKREHVYFHYKNGNYAFFLNSDKDPEFLEDVLSRIEDVNGASDGCCEGKR